MRHTLITTTAAAAVALGLLAGCATNQAGQTDGTFATSPAAARYEQLVTDIWGTSADRQLADRLAHHRMQQAIATCMRDAGHDYQPPAYQGIGGAAPIAIGDIDGVAPLGHDWGIAAGKIQSATGVQQTRLAGGNPAGLATGEAGKAYTAAMDKCQNAGDTFIANTYPTGVVDQSTSLENGLREVTGTEQYQQLDAEYLDCLGQTGIYVKSWAELHQQTVARFPAVSTGVDELRRLQPFLAASEAEKVAAAADAQCRSDLYAYTVTAIGPHIDRMRGEGGKALAEVVNGWNTLRTEATAAGLN
ncbi:hypothetical protein AB0M47_21040 [Hamadaea sp. NPDC051192]|uniref:hypothetical protein n=1 Tax=Hamadaea sp. NPDC051192 TaxID=3154940 RepID=UPI003414EAA4